MSDRLEALLNFFEKDPHDTFTIYGIALEFLSNKKYDKAEEYLTLLLKEDPDYVPAYMQYGQLASTLGRIDEARTLFNNGIIAANKSGDKRSAKEMEEFLDELE